MKKILAIFSLIIAMLATSMPVSALAAAVEARIDLSSQTMRVYRYGKLKHVWKVSTARRGYRTPIGTYRPQRMYREYYSKKYYNSPMPHSIFFRGGYAIHGTGAIKSLGRPASHGCVRLHPANARALYNMVRKVGPRNARIRITR